LQEDSPLKPTHGICPTTEQFQCVVNVNNDVVFFGQKFKNFYQSGRMIFVLYILIQVLLAVKNFQNTISKCKAIIDNELDKNGWSFLNACGTRYTFLHSMVCF
jgi:hypothetical protein